MYRTYSLLTTKAKNLLCGRPKNIALVGNHESAKNFSTAIDSSDYIIRINTAPYCGEAGSRTDVLAVINWSSPAYFYITGAQQINRLALESAKEYWLPMPREEMYLVKSEQKNPPPFPAYTDFTTEITHMVTGKGRVIHFPPWIWRRLTKDLRELGADATHAASTGALIAYYLVSAFPRSAIHLFGFTHEGWPGHPWEAERRWMQSRDNIFKY
jgi:hypothetical protein